MKPWFFRLPLRHLAFYPGRTLLQIVGIALGTAAYLSISLAAASAVRSFQDGLTAVAGQAQLRLTAPGVPLDETLLPWLRRLPEVRAAAPVVESVVEVATPAPEPVLLLGLDFFSEVPFRAYALDSEAAQEPSVLTAFLTQPDQVLVSAPLAQKLRVHPGDNLSVIVGARRRSLRVAGLFTTPGDFYPLSGAVMLMDIAVAQELLDRVGGLDSIDLKVQGDPSRVAARLRPALPPGVNLAPPGDRVRNLEGLVSAYRFNLSVLSAIALFVGMFLIYQSVTVSVVSRRREIGLLRTLGMTRRQVLALFLGEGVVAGILGGLLGLGLGVLLARGATRLMGQSLTSLYQVVRLEEVWVGLPLLFQAWLLAVAATLAAAWLPAREASHTRLRAAWHHQELEAKLDSRVGAIFLAGLVLLALAGAVALLKTTGPLPVPGLLSAFLIFLAFALFTPWVVRTWGRGCEPVWRRLLGAAGELGCRYLAGSLSRSAVSIAALATAVGLLVAVVIMIGSFRHTVNQWVLKSISGDIFLGPSVFSTAAYDHYLPPEVLAELEQDPAIADLYHYRCLRIPFGDRLVLVIGGSFEVLERQGALWFRQGEGADLMRRARLAGQVIVSEPFAEIFGLREGSSFTLPTPTGPHSVTVAGVFYDFRTDGSGIWMDIGLFRRLWQDRHLNAVRLFLHDKSQIDSFRLRLQEHYGNRHRLLALSHEDLRQGILRIFDETFAITYALEAVAVAVAVFGIITTFLVLIMERERDLALLQALGASRRHILSMVLVEAGQASLLSYLLGASSGSLLALLLIRVVNKQAFGWTIQLFWDPTIYWQSLILVLVLGLAAGAYPAWQALHTPLAAILKEE